MYTSQPQEKSPIPTERRVDVWLLPLFNDEATTGAIQSALCLLPDTERRVADEIMSNRERVLYIGSRILLRTALSQYTGVLPAAWIFGSRKSGKPKIFSPECHRKIKFNISHAHELAVCAISASAEVGVDIEYIALNRDFSGIAKRFFSPQEIQALEDADPANARKLFYRLWTLKEAYLKGKGFGFPEELPLCRFDFFPEPRLILDAMSNDDTVAWRFHSSCLLKQTYFLAVAMRGIGQLGIDVRLRWINAATDLPRLLDISNRIDSDAPG